MARYTDIDLLIDKVEETTWYHINKNGELVVGENPGRNIPLYKHSDITRVLSEAPEADVVEVVRCKDCKHCEIYYPAKHLGIESVKNFYCNLAKGIRFETDYCSFGERKE